MGADLMRTFFNHCVQPLHQRVTTMWLSYPGLSCLDCPFSEELGDMEINN
jgi:hypothetical protein